MDDPKARYREKGRKSAPPESRVKLYAASIISFLTETAEYQRAQKVGLFSALAWEVNLAGLLQEELGRKLGKKSGRKLAKRFAFPRVEGSGLRFYAVDRLAELKPGYANILEPPLRDVIDWSVGDLILVPGLMFDIHGARVGSGKGFYDKFFSGLSEYPSKFGVCWHAQLSKQRLPQHRKDVSMDAVCTEKGLWR